MSENGHGGTPTVLRMILGKQLQALREKAGLTYEQAGDAIYSSPWTVRRMERAEGGLKPLTVKGLLTAYGITAAREVDAFLSLCREASKPGWWHSYNDVLPGWFRTFVGLEEAASSVRGYDPHWIPGLLQTADYAHASVRTGFPDATDSEAERRVALRLARQQILDRPQPPRLWLVIDETALRRPTATTGASVMRAQIDRLIEAAAQPGVTVQVLPLGQRRPAPGDVRPVPDLPLRRERTAQHRLRGNHDQRLLPRQTRRGGRIRQGPGPDLRPGRPARPDRPHPYHDPQGDLA